MALTLTAVAGLPLVEPGDDLTTLLLEALDRQGEALRNGDLLVVAQKIVSGGALKENKLNLFEVAIRCYDPCLSCSTHSYGKMPLEVELRNSRGETTQVAWHGKQTP